MNPLRIYDYLASARGRVFDAVRPLTAEQYGRAFPFGPKSIAVTLTHTMVAEGYYVVRLEGRDVPPYAEWPIRDEEPPTFAVLEPAWHEQAKRTRAAIAAERDWDRRISWLSFPNDAGQRFNIRTSPSDLVTQLILHEVHHRAQVMAMLRMLGDSAKPVEDIDFNELMYERTPVNVA